MRKLIQDASLRKAEEKAEAKRKKQLTKGPHGNDADNKKEDLQQRVIRAISFNNITSSTTPSDNSALVRIMNTSSFDDDDTRDDET